jgi:mRNA-binding protein PUF3
VVSHVLEFGTEGEKTRIIERVIDDLIEMSLHKYGSNVVEMCLLHAPESLQLQILDRIVSVTPLNYQNCSFSLEALMSSRYGNYVVQRAYDLSD